MARTRTFWIIPGDVDEKTKKPREYAEKPSVPVLSGITRALGITREPVMVTETMTDDGEYSQTIDTPQGPQEIDHGVDSAYLDLSKARRQAQPDQPAARTPDQARKDAADADLARANADKATAPPPTITTPTGTVPKEQADYDLRLAAEQRQREADLLDRAQKAQDAIRQQALDRIAQDHWTAEQAHREFTERMSQLQLEVSKEQNAITTRGQDLSAETTRRGQDMSLQGSREGDVMRLAGDIAARNMQGQTWATPGQWAGLESSMNATRAGTGAAPLSINPSPTPMYDPMAFAAQAQQRAQMAGQGQFVLPGTPPTQPTVPLPPAPQPQYVLPG